MTNNRVIIAGGGIGGLATALTLHQIGVPCIVFEAVREMRPLGVGINLQPNAVRELYDLGFTEADLDRVGLPAKEWALVGLNGNDIYSEPRGLLAGYNWPQYAVHRGQFHMLLHEKVMERIGPETVRLGSRVTGYRKNSDGGVSALIEHADGSTSEASGALLIGADGIHSAIRAADAPRSAADPLGWGGHVARHDLGEADPHRLLLRRPGYASPADRLLSHLPPRSATRVSSMINWIAEVTMDNAEGWKQSGWFRQVSVREFLHHFTGWIWDWLDVPVLIKQADTVFENPMIDRDPVPTWRDGPVVLLGDAAHAMYPTGSNGGSQAIIDARVLGACMVEHGVTSEALAAYDEKLCGPISKLILRNRGAGPFGLLNIVDERCGGTFDNIDDVIPPQERAEFMAGYRAAAGFAIETLNRAPPTIPHGARARAVQTA